MGKKVLLGMSGGVDSAVAAILLINKGYDVTGVTLKLNPERNKDEDYKTCCSLNDISDARRIAYQIGIDHIVMNFTKNFEKDVIQNFINGYLAGQTPNPCVDCNKYVKFDALLRRADELGFDYIATGHYAGIYYDEKSKTYFLKKSKSKKDQSYFLYNMTQDQLSRTLFPIGDMEKDEVRNIAKSYDLHIANKHDSQEICFVPNNKYAEFIKSRIKNTIPKGNFIDLNGKFLGKHNGFINYTLGQRRGLGIALGKHMYVYGINPKENTVTLCEEKDRYINSVIVSKLNFISKEYPFSPLRASVKIRNQALPVPALLVPMDKDKIKVEFDEKQKLSAPGQSAVFYDGDFVLGGGIII